MKKPGRKLGLVVDPATSELIGQHPDEVTQADLTELGHGRRPWLKLVRAFCRDCCGGGTAEIRKCTRVTCPFWPYRMGKRPAVWRRAESGAAARAKKNTR